MTTPIDRPPKPTRRYPYIEAKWSAREIRWMWRGYAGSRRTRVKGSLRRTQKEAHDDATRLRRADRDAPVAALTVREAFERMIQAVRDKHGSEHTVRGYRQKRDKWLPLLPADVPVTAVDAEDVRAFCRRRTKEHKVGPNTVAGDLAVLHRLFSVAGVPDHMNPARKEVVERPEKREPVRTFFTVAALREIDIRIRTSGQREANWHADVLAFVGMTGVRAYELERMRLVDDVLYVQGKRGGWRAIPLDREAELPLAEKVIKRGVSPTTLSTITTRWQKRLGIPGLHGRSLRRSWATAAAEFGDLRTVQAVLGHRHLATTQRYLDVPRARVAKLLGSLRRERERPPEQSGGEPSPGRDAPEDA